MELRPIHLTSESRCEQLRKKFEINLPLEWIGQVIFEFKDLTANEIFALSDWFKRRKQLVLKADVEQNILLVKSGHLSNGLLSKTMPEVFKKDLRRMVEFLKKRKSIHWEWGRGRSLDFSKAPFIMGILNVTPDSFSDGGKFYDPEQAVNHALRLVEEGADIIDIGGESTRPGAEPVTINEELRRVIPVIEALKKKSDVLISVDTYKSTVAKQALRAGADMVNDISGARFDSEMSNVIRRINCPLIIMHIKGRPRDMQKNPFYEDVIEEIYDYFEERLSYLASQKIKMVLLDPGIGFGKRVEDNLKLLRDLKDFTFFNKPILIGTSRKSFIGHILNKEVDQRLYGSLATQMMAVQNGASIVRVHDVAAARDALKILEAINNA